MCQKKKLDEEKQKNDIKYNAIILNDGDKFGELITTPCTVENIHIDGLVDSGATTSCISKSWLEDHKLKFIENKVGTITVISDTINRIGYIDNISLSNGKNNLKVKLEVVNIKSKWNLILGTDLFKKLNYEIRNIPFLPPIKEEELPPVKKKEMTAGLPKGVDVNGIADKWKQVLEDNKMIPEDSRCLILNSEVAIDTGNAEPIWENQYQIPQFYDEAVDENIKKWLANKVIQPAKKRL